MFESIFNNGAGTLSVSNALLCTLVAFLLGLMIAIVYMKTEKHYTKHFIITLTLLPLLVQVVIMMVNGNLGTSVAIMGSFALIRFRSMPATSKEITCVFFAMAVGLSIGTGYLTFSIAFTVIINIILLILDKIHFGSKKQEMKLLKITIPESLDYSDVFRDLLDTYTNHYHLTKVKTTNLGSLFELTYQIILKNDKNEKQLIDELRCRNGNLSISIHNDEFGTMIL